MDRTQTSEAPAGWHADRFEPPRHKATSATVVGVRIELNDALVRWGASALERARSEQDWLELRDAGWLLGGLSRAVVVSVLHQFQRRAPAALDRGVQRLGELCGALLLEHLCATRDVENPLRRPLRLHGTRKAVALARWISRDPSRFAARFERVFRLTPREATRAFLAFITATEQQPARRLSCSIYGCASGE